MKKKQTDTDVTFATVKKLRGDWGAVNPVTRVIPDKRRRKAKHEKRELQRALD